MNVRFSVTRCQKKGNPFELAEAIFWLIFEGTLRPPKTFHQRTQGEDSYFVHYKYPRDSCYYQVCYYLTCCSGVSRPSRRRMASRDLAPATADEEPAASPEVCGNGNRPTTVCQHVRTYFEVWYNRIPWYQLLLIVHKSSIRVFAKVRF